MLGRIVICGDSFSIGIGCKDLTRDAWGPLLSNHYKREVVNFAKGSSTNYSISLQVDYAIENVENIDLLIISDTSEDRVNFFKEEQHLKRSANEVEMSITNLDVNYHEYPPYGPGTYHQIIPHPYINNPDYKGTLNTENYHGVIEYTDRLLEKSGVVTGSYYEKFKGEDKRLLLLRDYCFNINDIGIQRKHDIGCLVMSYLKAKKAQIPVILAMDKSEIQNIVPPEDYLHLSWGDLALKYPDTLPSWHTSEEGHLEAYNSVVNFITENNLLYEEA